MAKESKWSRLSSALIYVEELERMVREMKREEDFSCKRLNECHIGVSNVWRLLKSMEEEGE